MKKLFTVVTASIFIFMMNADVSAQKSSLDASIERGKMIYSSNCASCHMAAGTGVPGTYPPFAGSDSLVADEARMVNAVVNGVQGVVKVQGKTYAGAMQPVDLSNKELADLMNYIRNSWGNSGEKVTPKQVKKLRKKTKK